MNNTNGTAGFICLIILLAATIIDEAQSHEWYENRCCNEKDCREAAPGDVEVTPEGYRIHSLNLTVPYRSEKVRFPPPDGRYHICTHHELGFFLCLYPKGVGF